MAEMICDLLERYALCQQMRRAGVQESVRAVTWEDKPEPLETVAYHRAKSRSSEGSIRLDTSYKEERDVVRRRAGPS